MVTSKKRPGDRSSSTSHSLADSVIGDLTLGYPICALLLRAIMPSTEQEFLMLFEGAVLQEPHPAGLRPAYRPRSKGRILQSGFK